MKATLPFIIMLLLSNTAQSQLTFGKSSVESSSALIEFGTEVRGMALSPVQGTTSMTASAGTLVFDGQTGSLRLYDGTQWNPAVAGGVTGGTLMGTDTKKYLIGATETTANGVVVMGRDTNEDRALVLPKLSDGRPLFSDPKPGLMFYDTLLKQVMVYNGNAWVAY